ncbi:phosphoenolpyruvate--protein phosphotransferase [Serratia sp. L9]|uniref:phosphoenolpyruvate--protein phosphotransferase n=1 Tax=Serratia sp. L9 TaxID=3423946 RepID=UPI003D67A95E
MVGIVIVSHSRRLAEGVAELATQMTQGKAALAVAAGVNDPENPIGTDAIAIMTAIEEVYHDDGVVVLMDLGSALLSTEMALELLDDEMRSRVFMSAAPLVEGTMAAVVAAAAGLNAQQVLQEAESALEAKQDHLGVTAPVLPMASSTPTLEALRSEWRIANPHGLHARPAAAIVGTLAGLDAEVWLERAGQRVNARSLNSIAKLAVKLGDRIDFITSGPQANEAVAAFNTLAQNHFGEAHLLNETLHEPETETLPEQKVTGAISGIAVNGGIARGPAVIFTAVMPAIPERPYQGVASESQNLDQAIAQVQQHLQQQAKGPQGDIFNAHSLMLADPELLVRLRAAIGQGQIAPAAWINTLQQLAQEYAQADSQYMREREADVWDITRQVMCQLTGNAPQRLQLAEPSILLARDLMPSDVANLDKDRVVALCLSEGAKTSHSAILARAMGIPAIVKAQGCLEQVHNGQEVILDGFSGLLWLAPDEPTAQALETQRVGWLEQRHNQRLAANQPAVTQDGQAIQILANIGGPEDVAAALAAGAEGVGLFRTEFLFQAHDTLPDEELQYQIYRDIAASFGDKPLTIRSLDVGGDKPLAAFPMAQEENPFLGLRGVRLCLAHPELLMTQLRAVLRAHAEQTNIQLMIPMIATVEEFRAVKTRVEQARRALALPPEPKLALGIMVEVPAAVLNADVLAQEVDFFSIGTNDLTQYVMAADRGNSAVAALVNYHEPAVLKAIELTCQAGRCAGIPVSMCGEMAGDAAATALLLHLGLTKLSASASMLPALKAQVRVSRFNQEG